MFTVLVITPLISHICGNQQIIKGLNNEVILLLNCTVNLNIVFF